MNEPTFDDYVSLLSTLFDRFLQEYPPPKKRGRPGYPNKFWVLFFLIMHLKRVFRFQAQWRWLRKHPEHHARLGLASIPDRSVISRRYKALASVLEDFIAFVGEPAGDLDPRLRAHDVFADKSLCKAAGPVWHESDRKENRVPPKLRNLDQEATGSKSGYHGWVYGYGLHLVVNLAGMPQMARAATGKVSEKEHLAAQEEELLKRLQPDTVSGDNSSTKASRIRAWAKRGVCLLSPALRWREGRYAQEYHRFIKEPEQAELLAQRRVAIEPVFHLVAEVLGLSGPQQQLPVKGERNASSCLLLGVVGLQLAMVANSIWGLPLRAIGEMLAAFT